MVLVSCGAAELTVLGEKLGAMQALQTAGDVGMECVGVVEGALDKLEKCSDVVVGSSRQLASTQLPVRLLGVEALAGLPRVVLEESVVAEVEAAARRSDRKSTRLNSSHTAQSRMPSSA